MEGTSHSAAPTEAAGTGVTPDTLAGGLPVDRGEAHLLVVEADAGTGRVERKERGRNLLERTAGGEART
jgi:hypothetical protein